MKAVFLVNNYMPHQLVSITTLMIEYEIEVHAIAFKVHPPAPENTEQFASYFLKDYSRPQLRQLIKDIKPDILAVAGWAVPDFVWVAKQIKKQLNIPVVSYSDTQWQGAFRQKVNALISIWHLQKAFTHLWVAGIYQFEYARKLGFKKNQIIYNSLSCNTNLFEQCSLEIKQRYYPKNFLFIGRFIEVKGLDLLVQAWSNIVDKKGWKLTLIGDGQLKDKFQGINSVIIKDFMPQNELVNEMEQAGCFVLPSVFEPWALVIHEAAAAGLPIIATDVCGAAPHFVISGHNGYQIQPSVNSIQNALEKIINLNKEELLYFSKNSKALAQSITPELGSAQLMSVIKSK